MKKYKGIIIEESLEDNRILNKLEIIKFRVTAQENPVERWHMYTTMVTEDNINELSLNIKDEWYMHFWKDRNVIAIFKGKRFEFNYDDKASWEPVVQYGLSVGIVENQLDFPID